MSNCCYNPIVYCWMNDKFRNGFRYAFRWVPGVRCPDASSGVMGGQWVVDGGRTTTMYGGMTASPGAVARPSASAAVASYVVGRSGRVQTDVVASPARRSDAQFRDLRCRASPERMETIVESHQLKPTNRTAWHANASIANLRGVLKGFFFERHNLLTFPFHL